MTVSINASRQYQLAGGIYGLPGIAKILSDSDDASVPYTDICGERICSRHYIATTYYQIKMGHFTFSELLLRSCTRLTPPFQGQCFQGSMFPGVNALWRQCLPGIDRPECQRDARN